MWGKPLNGFIDWKGKFWNTVNKKYIIKKYIYIFKPESDIQTGAILVKLGYTSSE